MECQGEAKCVAGSKSKVAIVKSHVRQVSQSDVTT